MQRLDTLLAGLAALLLAVATGLGAWASHGLATTLPPAQLRTLEIAIDYQFFHALGVLALALTASRAPRPVWLRLGATGITTGALLFCGGLYASAFAGPGWLTGLAPIGGSILILAWLAVALAFLAGRAAR